MKKIIISIALLSLTACGGSYAERQEQARIDKIDQLANQARVRDSIPTCSSDSECLHKWEAAQIWVSNNSAYKIQTATTALIETYNATGGDTGLAMKVTKEPLGEGKYRLVMAARCDNMFGCSTSPIDAIQRFHDYINTIK